MTAIINKLLHDGWSASRINVQGQWDEALQRWRKSNSRKGVFDVLACIAGRFVAIDIKKGSDKLSKDQIKFQNEVNSAGGIAIEISTYSEFLNWYETLNTPKNALTTISEKRTC